MKSPAALKPIKTPHNEPISHPELAFSPSDIGVWEINKSELTSHLQSLLAITIRSYGILALLRDGTPAMLTHPVSPESVGSAGLPVVVQAKGAEVGFRETGLMWGGRHREFVEGWSGYKPYVLRCRKVSFFPSQDEGPPQLRRLLASVH